MNLSHEQQSSTVSSLLGKGHVDKDKSLLSNEVFASRLLQGLVSAAPKGGGPSNVFCSPMSVEVALALVLRAAAVGSEPHTQLLSALWPTAGSEDEVIESIRKLLRTPLTDHVALSIASSIWTRADSKKDYSDAVAKAFGAEIRAIGEGAPAVNAWVSAKTNGEIPVVVDALAADAHTVLVNAVYFKGEWKHKFDPARTEEATFGPARLPCHLMHQFFKDCPGGKLSSAPATAAMIPYDDRFSACFLLPTEGTHDCMGALMGNLQQALHETWDLGKKSVDLYCPRFKVEHSSSLVPILRAMGVTDAFEPGANFSRLTDSTLCFSDIVHKAVAKVDEEGTVAAASTVATIRAAVVRQVPLIMRLDREFLFAVCDIKRHVVHFIGQVNTV